MAEKEALDQMVKTINEDASYKVLTKDEYEALLALSSQRGDKSDLVTSTPKSPGERDGTRPKTKPDYQDPTVPKVTFAVPNQSPIARLNLFTHSVKQQNTSTFAPNQTRLNFSNQSLQQNTSAYTPNPYIPKLPIFSGNEEVQKGETSFEVWNYEVKCLQNSGYLPDHLLLQAIRNSLRGTARSMLIPLGESATVQDILLKLDGFYGNVATSETLIQSFYSDFQKDNESIVSFGSRLEQTLSRAIRYGHIDLVAKDAMLRSKFWTGLKSQVLKNSTRHLYDSIKDFQTLLREIRKVDMEETNLKASKKQAAQQLSGQVSTEDTNTQLLKQMSELMGRMKKMEDKLEQQNKAIPEAKKDSSNQDSYTYQYRPRGRGQGYGRGSWRGGYGRGYQSGNPQDTSEYTNSQRGEYTNSQRGYRGGRFRGSYQGGANGRGAHRGNNSGVDSGTAPLNR